MHGRPAPQRYRQVRYGLFDKKQIAQNVPFGHPVERISVPYLNVKFSSEAYYQMQLSGMYIEACISHIQIYSLFCRKWMVDTSLSHDHWVVWRWGSTVYIYRTDISKTLLDQMLIMTLKWTTRLSMKALKLTWYLKMMTRRIPNS